MGSHAARGKAVEINARVTPHGWKAGHWHRMSQPPRGWPSTPSWPTSPSTTASGTPSVGTCTMSLTASRATTTCRPNQVLAISLRHAVLVPACWQPVLKVIQQCLLTPVGLRSLAPDHPDYKARYDGDLRACDAAYHQGTVWAWLIGPLIDTWLKVCPDDYTGARRFLHGFEYIPAKPVLAPSAKSSMPKSRLRPVAAWRRPGVRGRSAAVLGEDQLPGSVEKPTSTTRNVWLEPENLHQMRDCAKFWVTSDNHGPRAQSSTDGKGISIRERKLRFHSGGFEDVSEGIGHWRDWECFEAMEKVLGPFQERVLAIM